MRNEDKIRIRAKHAALLQTQGRTPVEAESFRRVAAKIRLENPAAFLPDEAPACPPEPRAPEPRRPTGHLSDRLGLGVGPFTAHLRVLAVGLANELGCLLVTDGKEFYFFSTTKEPLKRAAEAQSYYSLSSEVDATRALGKISPGTNSERIQYYKSVWQRAAIGAILTERIRMTPKKRLEEAQKRQSLAEAAVDKVPGWLAVRQAPEDPWGGETKKP